MQSRSVASDVRGVRIVPVEEPCDELRTLMERRNYLSARIKAKTDVGWETIYDERECKALTWAIERLRP